VKNIVTCLTTKQIIIAEKSMVGTLPYKKFKLEQLFPNVSHLHTLECCIQRKKKNMWWLSDQHYKHTGGKRQTMHTPDRYGFKICENLTHCAGAKDVCGTMWLFLKSTYLVHPIKLVHCGVYDTHTWWTSTGLDTVHTLQAFVSSGVMILPEVFPYICFCYFVIKLVFCDCTWSKLHLFFSSNNDF